MSTVTRAWDAAMHLLRRYHSYEVIGADRVPRSGPVLVASTHSLATYENFLLGSAAVEQIGRRPYILADDLMFRVPLIAQALRDIGVIPGNRATAIDLLRRGEIIGLGPGGMREAIRSSRQKYRFDWAERLGFVWVSMLSGAPIILAACPGADDIYTVYDTPVTPWAYRQFHLPIALFRGLGISPLPRPVKLRHFLGEPIFPPRHAPEEVTESHVRAHHRYLVERMHDLMDTATRLRRL